MVQVVWKCQAGVSGSGCDAVASGSWAVARSAASGDSGGAACAEPARVWQGAWTGRQQHAGALLLLLGSGSSVAFILPLPSMS